MRRFAEALATVALAVSLPTLAHALSGLDEREAVRASQAVVGTTVPDFTLLDSHERPLRLSSLRGKPLLVSFIYTGCFAVCPMQTRSLDEAVKGLDRVFGPNRFNIVSIGFNQPFDSPQAMRSFAAQNRIDNASWKFLSPQARQVDALTRAFGFTYVATPAGFEHVVGVTVVDAQGRIYGQVYGSRLTAESIGVPLRQLILTASSERVVPTLDDLIGRVRVLCTVYDPETGEYRYDWKLLLEIVGGLAFFLSAAVYLWAEWRSQRPIDRAPATGRAN